MNQIIVDKLLEILNEKEILYGELEEIARALELNEPMFKDNGCIDEPIEPYKLSIMAHDLSYKALAFSELCCHFDKYIKLLHMIAEELNLNKQNNKE